MFRRPRAVERRLARPGEPPEPGHRELLGRGKRTPRTSAYSHEVMTLTWASSGMTPERLVGSPSSDGSINLDDLVALGEQRSHDLWQLFREQTKAVRHRVCYIPPGVAEERGIDRYVDRDLHLVNSDREEMIGLLVVTVSGYVVAFDGCDHIANVRYVDTGFFEEFAARGFGNRLARLNLAARGSPRLIERGREPFCMEEEDAVGPIEHDEARRSADNDLVGGDAQAYPSRCNRPRGSRSVGKARSGRTSGVCQRDGPLAERPLARAHGPRTSRAAVEDVVVLLCPGSAAAGVRQAVPQSRSRRIPDGPAGGAEA